VKQTAAPLVVAQAVSQRIFPAAAIDVGSSAGPLWSDALGTTTFDSPNLVTVQTAFDLASLTKPIATTSIAMELVGLGSVQLDDVVAAYFPEWSGADRESVTVRDLLEHTSGLPARLLDRPPTQRREFEHEICTMPLEYAPRSRSVYSDLGFILFAFLAADRAGKPFDRLFDDLAGRIGSERSARDRTSDASLRFGPIADAAPTIPMAEDVRRGRMLVGEVHDNYAAALGGVAGHAGLFGTAAAVGAFARVVLRASRGDNGVAPPWTPSMVARFTAKSTVAGSSRALGWDTMLPTSSCGTRMSPSAFGHVGYTGTSLWIDPERDRYFVLLTNRACGGGSLDQMREVRRAFHDAVA